MWRILVMVAFVGMMLAVGGCAEPVLETDAQRRASFAAVHEVVVAGQPLKEYLWPRTAVLLRNFAVDGVHLRRTQVTLDMMPRRNTDVQGLQSHAAAIEREGYFLTAQHAVESTDLHLVYWDGQSAQVAVPRVVATARNRLTGLDVAILHVDATLPAVFPRAGERWLGEKVAAGGSAQPARLGDRTLVITELFFAGVLQQQETIFDGVLLSHTAPLRPGDSGGPLVNMRGELVGINTRISMWLNVKRELAVMPSEEWIRGMIEKDRQTPHQRHGPIAAQGGVPVKGSISLVVSLTETITSGNGEVFLDLVK